MFKNTSIRVVAAGLLALLVALGNQSSAEASRVAYWQTCVPPEAFNSLRLGMHRDHIEEVLAGPGKSLNKTWTVYRACVTSDLRGTVALKYGAANRLLDGYWLED